jgi:hypothetical protein
MATNDSTKDGPPQRPARSEKSLKPKAGVFRRWSIVAWSIIIICVIAVTTGYYLNEKHDEYWEATVRRDALWEELYEPWGRELKAALAACPPSPLDCPDTEPVIERFNEQPDAKEYRAAMQAAFDLRWAKSMDGDGPMVIGGVIGAPLFVLWLLTAIVRFIFFGGK